MKWATCKKIVFHSLFIGVVTIEANYFYLHDRSQKTSALQKDSGLYTASCGMSLQGLSAGQILGYSTTPRNAQQLKADLAKDHANYISQQLQRVNEVSLQINKQF